MGFQHRAQKTTYRNHSIAAPSFWQTEFAVTLSLSDFDCAAKQIDAFPTNSEDFADPHSREHRKLNGCATRFG
jgi:hypothetical protein